MADMNNPGLDVEHFGDRTTDDRAKMRASVAAMKAATAADMDTALADVLSEIVGSYADKIDGIDALAVAASNSDPSAYEAATVQWQNGIDRQKRALPQLLAVARPYLSPAELSSWEQIVGAN